jgi:oligosaccharyltransferase complex subunit alpha (ribophorin I)
MRLISSAVVSAEGVNWSDEDVPIVPQVIKITNLLRTLDLSKPLIREITSAAIQNIASEDVTEYYFPVDQAYMDHLAYISAENRKTKEILQVTKDPEHYDPYVFRFCLLRLRIRV